MPSLRIDTPTPRSSKIDQPHMKFYLKENNIILILWTICIVIFFFQVFLSSISIVSNIALVFLTGLSLKKSQKKDYPLILGILTFTLFLISIGIINQNELSLIIRFGIVVSLIPLAYFVILPTSKCLKVLFILATLMGFLMILGEIYMLSLSPQEASDIRHFLLNQNLGDVYTFGTYYKIQVRGTSLLPFAFMFSFSGIKLFSKRVMILLRLILLSGVFIAGNFAYYISIFIFLLLLFFWNNKNVKQLAGAVFVLTILLLIISPFVFEYASSTMEAKASGSNAIRVEQGTLLMNDLFDNPISGIFGQGLGNTIDASTHFRNYKDNIYFELQTLYFLNQMGIVSFLIFVMLNVYLAIKCIKLKKLLVLYALYVLYAFTNPYILDTTQIIVIISLVTANKFLISSQSKSNENRLCISSL